MKFLSVKEYDNDVYCTKNLQHLIFLGIVGVTKNNNK